MRTVFQDTLHTFQGKNVTFDELIEKGGLNYEVEKCELTANRPAPFGDTKMEHLVATYKKETGDERKVEMII